MEEFDQFELPYTPDVSSMSASLVSNRFLGSEVESMPLIQVVIALIVVGILLWLINTFIPMAGSIKSILNAVVVICVVVWLLNVFGLMSSIYHFHVPPMPRSN